ncbi:tRNA(Ile)-lysidine synthase [Synechococcus sp. MIT S9509]|uniref:tRNA lysidine(34) synthetase TilS n=1 Tax=Synechococcus sp. MIT S9509 TaxID=1801630 RepID=UPI0007BBA7D6|nr:tRNA lysidine(34) synthetase TilS [Synechococcus sp. MIT S9509]KZR91677.1 tRNA(Ile)-lysidine synthase [Synechococcus sp. MIT S9509]
MTAGEPWLNWHDRLHRQLLQNPQLLPKGATLLLAISGGQDSMALLGLLRDLSSRHHWTLQLWHGDHGWHPRSARIAADLTSWCQTHQLPLLVSTSTFSTTGSEAKARAWRYAQLHQTCQQLNLHKTGEPCRTVVTAHTASDRAESLLLQLSRGTDLAGLGNMRWQRTLNADATDDIQLVRPLLHFSRDDTSAICRDLQLPIWTDPSNSDPRFDRNRIRQEVLPVLEALHPGCSRRMAELSERVSQLQDTQSALMKLSLENLKGADGALKRTPLQQLPDSARRLLLHGWLQAQGMPALSARQLEELSSAIGPSQPPGERHLAGQKRLHWCRNWVQLENNR